MNNLPLLFALVSLLTSCSYAISPDTIGKADRSITFASFHDDPAPHRGKILIFGGTIVQASSPDGGTLIEIAEKPLDYWGKPERTTRAGGILYVLHPAALNLLAFAPGTDITVAGSVPEEGSVTLRDGRKLHPALLVREIRLWPKERPSWDTPQWMDPLYDPDSSGRRN